MKARTLVIYADNGMFTAEQKNAFLSYRPGTLRMDLEQASHDAHLDQFRQWMTTLKVFLIPVEEQISPDSQAAPLERR